MTILASPAGAVVGGPPTSNKSFQKTMKGIVAGTSSSFEISIYDKY